MEELVSIEDSDKLVCSGRFEYGLISRYARVPKSLVPVCISAPTEVWAGINICSFIYRPDNTFSQFLML
jgi:hypothetical protein